jgi:hypothetical protein
MRSCVERMGKPGSGAAGVAEKGKGKGRSARAGSRSTKSRNRGGRCRTGGGGLTRILRRSVAAASDDGTDTIGAGRREL